MVDDGSLRRFLAAAAVLKGSPRLDPLRMVELLHAMRDDGDAALAQPLDVALEAGLDAVATPEARNAAFACYAFERVTIAIEGRLRAAAASSPGDDACVRHRL